MHLPKLPKHDLQIDWGSTCANSLLLYSSLSPFSTIKGFPVTTPYSRYYMEPGDYEGSVRAAGFHDLCRQRRKTRARSRSTRARSRYEQNIRCDLCSWAPIVRPTASSSSSSLSQSVWSRCRTRKPNLAKTNRIFVVFRISVSAREVGFIVNHGQKSKLV